MEYSKKIDVIKAFAIWTVVYGHSIQFGSGEEVLNTGSFFENGVFQFIYSCHMPLFILVSGYLFYFSLNRHTVNKVVKSHTSTQLTALGETTVITAGSLAITLLIKRVRVFNNLLLGGR